MSMHMLARYLNNMEDLYMAAPKVRSPSELKRKALRKDAEDQRPYREEHKKILEKLDRYAKTITTKRKK